METFDQLSIEKSKNLVKVLQELKSLRPQLYSAAEYCEKSYQYSEQKQTVHNNLKDYAVRALVNAVDHLGAVSYKLSELLEYQCLDISTLESKIAHLNQELLTCRMYMVKEGLRQHQLLAIIPRHHKHYTKPNSINKKVHFSLQIHMDPGRDMRAISWLYHSGATATNSRSWILASETKSTLRTSRDDIKGYGGPSGAFNVLDDEVIVREKSPPRSLQVGSASVGSHRAGKMIKV